MFQRALGAGRDQLPAGEAELLGVAKPVRLLELGCGEGQVIGALLKAHADDCAVDGSCGVDYSHPAIEKCRRLHPGVRFLEGDFTDTAFMESLGQYEIVLLVNALHEVFSAGYKASLGEVDVAAAKVRTEQALRAAAQRLAPGGWLALFDGLEPPGDPASLVRMRFRDLERRRRFETFAGEYRPFRITYTDTGDAFEVELSQRDFTRYITKSIFLDKRLWQTERLESYQYFTQAEFEAAFASLGLRIAHLRTLTVDYEKWRGEVEIVSPGVDFPAEHILILAHI